MNANQPEFWMMISSIIIAICFIVMAITFIVLAIIVRRVVKVVNRVEDKVGPLMEQVNVIGEEVKGVAIQFNELSGHLATASMHFSESTGMIKQEVDEIRQIVGHTAIVAKEKVDDVSAALTRTHDKVESTADFIHQKIVQPAFEVAAIMAAVRKGLEVLFAPSPKQIDKAYHEDEMFIG
ncbi:MAG: hypothetical protein ACK5NT_06470 [Pyrinomonadaceae bacterium]